MILKKFVPRLTASRIMRVAKRLPGHVGHGGDARGDVGGDVSDVWCRALRASQHHVDQDWYALFHAVAAPQVSPLSAQSIPLSCS